ncbi:hypothetical protein FB451DRAFT_1384670 [Mycena latifolia]|nr:hypothetical protein FB451DRAFT_1384670 [Mycena latifolia]
MTAKAAFPDAARRALPYSRAKAPGSMPAELVSQRNKVPRESPHCPVPWLREADAFAEGLPSLSRCFFAAQAALDFVAGLAFSLALALLSRSRIALALSYCSRIAVQLLWSLVYYLFENPKRNPSLSLRVIPFRLVAHFLATVLYLLYTPIYLLPRGRSFPGRAATPPRILRATPFRVVARFPTTSVVSPCVRCPCRLVSFLISVLQISCLPRVTPRK